MLREPPAGCQEPGLAEAPWGRRVPPQEEAPGEGDGSGGEPALRAKARVLRAWAGSKGLDQEVRLGLVLPPKAGKEMEGAGRDWQTPGHLA